MWIEKGDIKVVFDIEVPTPKGTLYCMYFKRKKDNNEVTAAIKNHGVKISEQLAHELTGHMDKEQSRKTMKEM